MGAGIGGGREGEEEGGVEEGYSWVMERRRMAIAWRVSVLFGNSFPLSFVTVSCKNEKSVSTTNKNLEHKRKQKMKKGTSFC